MTGKLVLKKRISAIVNNIFIHFQKHTTNIHLPSTMVQEQDGFLMWGILHLCSGHQKGLDLFCHLPYV